MPTADILPYKEFNLWADAYVTAANTSEAMIFYKANLGTSQGLELGFVGNTEEHSTRLREGVFINLKYSLAAEDGIDPLRIAFGVENLTSNTQSDVYMVVTKPIKNLLRLHLGFMGDFPQNKFRTFGMLGAEFPFSSSMRVIGELFGGGDLFQVNAGVRFYILPSFSLTVAGLNLTNSSFPELCKNPRSAYAGFSWINPF